MWEEEKAIARITRCTRQEFIKIICDVYSSRILDQKQSFFSAFQLLDRNWRMIYLTKIWVVVTAVCKKATTPRNVTMCLLRIKSKSLLLTLIFFSLLTQYHGTLSEFLTKLLQATEISQPLAPHCLLQAHDTAANTGQITL